MKISTYQMFRNNYLIVFEHGNTIYRRNTQGASIRTILLTAAKIYWMEFTERLNKKAKVVL